MHAFYVMHKPPLPSCQQLLRVPRGPPPGCDRVCCLVRRSPSPQHRLRSAEGQIKGCRGSITRCFILCSRHYIMRMQWEHDALPKDNKGMCWRCVVWSRCPFAVALRDTRPLCVFKTAFECATPCYDSIKVAFVEACVCVHVCVWPYSERLLEKRSSWRLELLWTHESLQNCPTTEHFIIIWLMPGAGMYCTHTYTVHCVCVCGCVYCTRDMFRSLLQLPQTERHSNKIPEQKTITWLRKCWQCVIAAGK